MADYYNSLSDDAKLTADEYMMNYVASLRDRDEIQNFSLSRFSDKMVGVVKGAIDFASIAAGILLSAVGAPLVAVVVAPLLLEAINVKICLEQENNAEAVLRIIGMAVGAGIGIKNIVKAGTSAFKVVAKTYGDDVARAIAEYGDDIAEIAKHYGDDVVTMAKRHFADIDEVVKTASGQVLKGSTTSYRAVADIGNKLDYVFGQATGNVHNIQRSQAMADELKRIGIHDTPANRAILQDHLDKLIRDYNNISGTEIRSYIAKELPGQPVVEYTATIRESFFMGPGGGVKLETVWDSDRLLTIIIKGGQ